MLNHDTRKKLDNLSTSLLADARFRLDLPESHLDSDIHPVIPFSKMVGSAVTIALQVESNPQAANLRPMINVFESQSETSGAVMVIELPVELHRYGIFGEGSATIARKHGFVGALIEGAVRDVADLNRIKFPVFSRTVSPGYMVGQASVASVGEPVNVGGQTIHQDDLLIADADGAIVIRPNELNDVIAKAETIAAWEKKFHKLLTNQSYAETLKITGPTP